MARRLVGRILAGAVGSLNLLDLVLPGKVGTAISPTFSKDVAPIFQARCDAVLAYREMSPAPASSSFAYFRKNQSNRSFELLAVRRLLRLLTNVVRLFLNWSCVAYADGQFASADREFFLTHGAHPPRLNSLSIFSSPVAVA